MPKTALPMNAKQRHFVRMTAQGCSRAEMLLEVFGLDISDPDVDKKAVNAADQKMFRWRRHPEYEGLWKEEIRQQLMACAGSAYRVLRNQITDDKQPWLANKAANDLLNHGRPQIYGAEENTVNVRIEGLPDIGSPDSEDV